MSIPTQGEGYAKLTEYLRLAQEEAYTLSHLTHSMSSSPKDKAIADGWFAIGEMLKRMNFQVIKIAQGRMQ